MNDAKKARLEPLPIEDWGDAEKAALRTGFPEAAPVFLSGKPDAPRIPNVLGTMIHNPAITGPFLVFNSVLLQTPTLGARWRELMILRVAWRTRAPYEWLQHVRMGKEAGITDEEIRAIPQGADAGSWEPLEALLLAATDQLIDDYCIDDKTWARLAEHLDKQQLVELLFTVGAYTCLAMAFNSFGLQLDPGLEPDPTLPFPG